MSELEEVLVTADSVDPGAPRGFGDQLKLATALRDAGRNEDADAGFAGAVKADPEHRGALAAWIDCALRLRSWPEMLRRCDMMRKRFPDEPLGYALAGRALLELERHAEAEEVLAAAAQRFPRDRDTLFHRALSALRQRDWAEAVTRSMLLVEHFPDLLFGYLFSGRALLELGDYDRAEPLLAEATRRSPEDTGVFASWASRPEREQDWPEAARRWAQMRTRFPNHPLGYVRGGQALLEAGRFEELEALFVDASRNFADDRDLAEAQAELERLREAARLGRIAAAALRRSQTSAGGSAEPLKYVFRGHEQAGFFAHALMLGGNRELITPAAGNKPPPDEHYICLVPVLDFWRMDRYHAEQSQVSHYSTVLEDQVINDLRSRRALLILDLCNEGPGFDREIFHQLLEYLDAKAVPASQVVWLAQNRAISQHYFGAFGAARPDHLRFEYYDFFIKTMAWTFAINSAELYPPNPEMFATQMFAESSKDKLLLCLNATPRLHRVLTVAELIHRNWADASLVSFPGLSYAKAGHTREDILEFVKRTPELDYLEPALQEAMSIQNLRVDKFEETGNALFDKIDPNPYLRTFFSLVTETEHTDGAVDRITEKAVKPFCLGHPALIVGNPNATAFLKEFGFQDWSGVIDRSYESEKDALKRFKLLFSEVQKQVTAIHKNPAEWLCRVRDNGEANVQHAASGKFLARYVEQYDRRVVEQMCAALHPEISETANAPEGRNLRQVVLNSRASCGPDQQINAEPHRRRLPRTEFFEQLLDWCLKGCEDPAIDYLKIATVASYVEVSGYRRFIETGTLFGGTVATIGNYDVQCDTIELSPQFYEKARLQFANTPNVRVHFGDSGRVLPELLRAIDEPCVFWLDGHYSEGPTAKGDKDSPILEEFAAILNHRIRDHVVLIDDIRCFGQVEDWPPVSLFLDMARYYFPDSIAFVQHDILRIVPAELEARYRQAALALPKISF